MADEQGNITPLEQKVINIIDYTKSKDAIYKAGQYASGYHSINLGQKYFRGQRECNMRLSNVDYDFKGKIVLDIGCNIGGMLHSISDKIKHGVGIDNDHRLINAANRIKAFNGENILAFYMFDIEKEPLELIPDFMPSENIDIIFLLSVCMWLKDPEKLIGFCSKSSGLLLFETNGSDEQQSGQIAMLKKHYGSVKMVSEYSFDDEGQINRKLLLCEKNL